MERKLFDTRESAEAYIENRYAGKEKKRRAIDVDSLTDWSDFSLTQAQGEVNGYVIEEIGEEGIEQLAYIGWWEE